MTPADIHKRVRVIMDLRGDPEAAHAREDDLYRDVLGAIALGECDEPAECAAAALDSQQIVFPRYCA